MRRSRRSMGSPFQWARRRYDEVDQMMLAVVAAGLAIAIAIIFPRVLPASQQGSTCMDLAAPLGGNNRSVLAGSGDDIQELDLEIELESEQISVNEPLRVNLRFVNNDIGPVILYLEGSRPPVTTVDSTVGVRFEIRRLDNTPAVADESPRALAAGWPNVTVNPDQLHLLGSRSRCNQSYDYPVNQLAPGDYRIRAYYFNNNAGIWQSNVLPGDKLTPTPAYTDQGIWTRPIPIASDEVRFTVTSGP